MESKTGIVYLVGAGPGDPGLLTLLGRALLESADVIFYDYLTHPRLLYWAREEAEKIYVGKKGGTCSQAHQEQIHRQMIDAARLGKRVVRLKGGDPFIFGRGGEEAEALVAAGIPFEVVPGVTSAIAAPAYAGIPLTHREHASTVTFVTGHDDPDKQADPVAWGRIAAASDTLVVLMGMGNLAGIVCALQAAGKAASTPIALIQWGTYPHQKRLIGTLGDIVARVAAAQFKPPVVMVIGAVVGLSESLRWFETRPLFGKTIVITRAKEQPGGLADLLAAHGAETTLLPAIRIVPVANLGPLDDALDRLNQYDWIIFTSVNGVRFFRRRMQERRIDLRRLHGLRLCAIGPKTASTIEAWGVYVDLVPDEFRAEGVLAALTGVGITGQRFLLPRARTAREILPDEIRKRGGSIDVVPVYETHLPLLTPDRPGIEAGPIDMVTFASPSSVTNYLSIWGDRLQPKAVACIGPVTADCAIAHGLTVDVIPKTYTIPALADAVVDYFKCRASDVSVAPHHAPSP